MYRALGSDSSSRLNRAARSIFFISFFYMKLRRKGDRAGWSRMEDASPPAEYCCALASPVRATDAFPFAVLIWHPGSRQDLSVSPPYLALPAPPRSVPHTTWSHNNSRLGSPHACIKKKKRKRERERERGRVIGRIIAELAFCRRFHPISREMSTLDQISRLFPN